MKVINWTETKLVTATFPIFAAAVSKFFSDIFFSLFDFGRKTISKREKVNLLVKAGKSMKFEKRKMREIQCWDFTTREKLPGKNFRENLEKSAEKGKTYKKSRVHSSPKLREDGFFYF